MSEDPPTGGPAGPAAGSQGRSAPSADLVALAQRALALEQAGDRTGADVALAELVAASVESGELAALMEWIRASGVARAAARRILFDEHDVADTEQMTLIVVATRIADHRGGSFRAWIRTIAANEAKMLIRSRDRRRRRTEAAGAEDLDRGGRPGGRLGRISSLIADQRLLQDAIEGLTPALREAFVLRDVHDLEYRDIAERLDIPLDTAKTRVRRARQHLRATLLEQFVS